jgi:hypothetical protein
LSPQFKTSMIARRRGRSRCWKSLSPCHNALDGLLMGENYRLAEDIMADGRRRDLAGAFVRGLFVSTAALRPAH